MLVDELIKKYNPQPQVQSGVTVSPGNTVNPGSMATFTQPADQDAYTSSGPGKVPTISPTDAEDTDSAMEWLEKWLPNMTAFWTDYSNSQIQGADQVSQQAMESYNQKMNEVAGLFNSGFQSLDDQLKKTLGLYDAGTGMMSDLYDKANLGGLLEQIQTGSINPAVDAVLQKIKANQYDEAQRQIGINAQTTLNPLLQKQGAYGMLDSTRTGSIIGDVQGKALGELGSISRNLENEYLATRLGYPKSVLESSISALSGALPAVNTVMNAGTSGYDTVNKNFNDAISLAMEQAGMPIEYFKMAREVPNLSIERSNDYLNNILNIWKELLDYDISMENIDAHRDINSPSFWDILGF